MISRLLNPKRYQLKKDCSQIVLRGHPWIFRSHLSTAANVFPSGQWLKLVDSENHTLGFGIYENDGLIGIRLIKQGATEPNIQWMEKRVDRALARREPLRKYTDAFRVIHGENDGFPGIVMDVYGDCGVLQTYSPVVDNLGRYLSHLVRKKLNLKSVLWKFPAKRKRGEKSDRVLYGKAPQAISFKEGRLQMTVDVSSGQKSGTFLDLRGLRKWTAAQRLQGKRVLNLFSYSGTLGLAAELAGAKEIWNVDISQGALDFSRQYHTLDKTKHRFIAADIFDWLKDLPESEKFDLIIVDPPQMASQSKHVPKAMATYQKLYRSAIPHLAKHGRMVAACCTSRITPYYFRKVVDESVKPLAGWKSSLPPEDDHPVGFPEGEYLKIFIYHGK